MSNLLESKRRTWSLPMGNQKYLTFLEITVELNVLKGEIIGSNEFLLRRIAVLHNYILVYCRVLLLYNFIQI